MVKGGEGNRRDLFSRHEPVRSDSTSGSGQSPSIGIWMEAQIDPTINTDQVLNMFRVLRQQKISKKPGRGWTNRLTSPLDCGRCGSASMGVRLTLLRTRNNYSWSCWVLDIWNWLYRVPRLLVPDCSIRLLFNK